MCISNLANKYQFSLWDLIYNIVIIVQPCYKVVAMSGDCHNLVTTLFLVNKLVTIFSQGCYKIVAMLNNLVTILSQDCYNFVISIWDAVHQYFPRQISQ